MSAVWGKLTGDGGDSGTRAGRGGQGRIGVHANALAALGGIEAEEGVD